MKRALGLLAAGLAALGAQSQTPAPNSTPAPTLLRIDATQAVPAPLSSHLKLGSAVAPDGRRIEANSRFLSLAGKPWLPVMGEFHYSRTPAAQWQGELQKMKSAGIDIVASYVIWNHHEAQDGVFDWQGAQGERDLRRFLQEAQAAGLKAFVRIGPWVHAEVRYGGIPDWVVDAMPTRRDDAQYLAVVERLYGQIAQQLQGLLWKEGGPVIGIQLENEYNLGGPGAGAQHIATLKRMARDAGMDVPLYTVTGWDGAVYPVGEVIPVFGGYPDEPWSRRTDEMPPKETYAFRFDSRVSGDLGAQTKAHGRGTAETDAHLTPFFGAEYGAGLPAMYRRRTLVSSLDIAAMLPVQLGSGVNLLGYYMFHGGRNPRGVALEETTLSGGYNDTPRINYDFQAPLGPDGQQREVLTQLRPVHYFLRSWGEQLATMTVRKPEQLPSDARDLTTPRAALRANGRRGFLFVNHHVRQYQLAEPTGLRFEIRLPQQTLTLPRVGMALKNGDAFIWPLNLDVGGTELVYATAQPVTKIEGLQVFMSDAPAEFAFSSADAAFVEAPGAERHEVEGQVVFGGIQPGSTPQLTIRKPGLPVQRLLLLKQAQAQSLVVGRFAGRERLLLSESQAWFHADGLALRQVGDPVLGFAIYPPLERAPRAQPALRAAGHDGIFQRFSAQLPAHRAELGVQLLRAAGNAPPIPKGGHANAAMQPIPEAWRTAAAWTLSLPQLPQDPAIDDWLLQLDPVADMGRLFAGTRLLDDWYVNGQRWEIGLRGLGQELKAGPLRLSLLPLRADAPIYWPREHRPDFAGQAQIADLRAARLLPVYRLRVSP